jgi:predicted transglutaminase-like cysteine proteinase
LQREASIPATGGLRWRLVAACGLACMVLLGVAALASNYDLLQAHAVQRWGAGITSKFTAWRTLVANLAGAADTERLKRVNDFVNRQTLFGEDMAIWGQQDYWATPLETMGKGAGDCEDFAIFKYFSLREAGVARDKLRLIYVRAKTGADGSAPLQAHMVLAYYAQPDAEPLVLDNLIGDIKPASRRPDLVPVFSFNSDGVFSGVSGQDSKPTAGTGRLSRWEDLLQRAKAEGFE